MLTTCTPEDRRESDISERAAKARFLQVMLNDDPADIDEWTMTVVKSAAYRSQCDVGEVIDRLMAGGKVESPYPETVMVRTGDDHIEMPRWTVMQLEEIAYETGTTVDEVLRGMVEGSMCEVGKLH